MSKRDTIAAMVRKAQNPAATQAEAESAMAKAMQMAAKFGLSLEDIAANNEEANAFNERRIKGHDTHYNVIDVRVGKQIAKFCCCKAYGERRDDGFYSVYFGHDADVELALYLRQTFIDALANDWRVYRHYVMPKNANVKRERSAFVVGFTEALNKRLKEMMQQAGKDTTGRELIVVKNQLVEQKWAEKNIRLTPIVGRAARGGAAGAAGRAAGDAVRIGRGVSAGNVKLLS